MVHIQRKIPEKSGIFLTPHRYQCDVIIWSECRDLNPRPLGPEPSAIPNFATPRKLGYYSADFGICQGVFSPFPGFFRRLGQKPPKHSRDIVKPAGQQLPPCILPACAAATLPGRRRSWGRNRRSRPARRAIGRWSWPGGRKNRRRRRRTCGYRHCRPSRRETASVYPGRG